MPPPLKSALHLSVAVETFAIAGSFTISRGSRTTATVVVATLNDGQHQGWGECVPYARYGETVDGVVAQIRAVADVADQAALQLRLPAGAARNALDCAFWDLAAKQSGRSVADRLGLAGPAGPLPTCFTLSLDAPDAMAAKAKSARDMPLLKLKLGGGVLDAARLRQVRAARPDARLVADANEAWTATELPSLLAVAAETGVELIEQPLPAGADQALASTPHLVPICADESVHETNDLARLTGLYDAVNIKLDKTGGLTGALALAQAARDHDLKIMVGCMVSTSLAMAPAFQLASFADWLDLDGPLLLAADREPGITYAKGRIIAAPRALWG